MPANVQLEKAYDPGQVEGDMLALWERHEAFRALPDDRPRDRRFVVMIPLPNVTGTLHLGHAINNTLQDIMTRWHRMRGFNSLYQPGTDHAGIATQAVVERRILQEEGKSRHDLGREELVRRIWEWKAQYEARIIQQLKMMGCSCDWQRVRFTLDDRYVDSVYETFFQWFKAGLVYRGERLVNWDTELRTAVADDEVYHETVRGNFWHFKYPIKNPPAGGPTHLGFATTRPETMLGDTALAVNPQDQRYASLVGRTALIPLFDPPREIPIIADEWADPELGTGCVKITPAHDANDEKVGLRHNLPKINALTPEGRVSEAGGKYVGMHFSTEARSAVVDDMRALDLLDRIEDKDVDIPHSDRSKSPIEPFRSPQWFLRMGDIPDGVKFPGGPKATGLAQAAMDAVNDGRVRIIPERYKRTYLDWLGEKRDWCISRQLWWGHRIPVWRATERAHDLVLNRPDDLEIRSRLKALQSEGKVYHTFAPTLIRDFEFSAGQILKDIWGYWCPRPDALEEFKQFVEPLGFEQDPDVLDTWFSSQLWPFATLGWPEKTADLDYYYPGTVLITSRDIITLWVARMVLSGLYNIGQLPFRDVYIHPKILDGRGETMSKSKGNGVDPVDIIQTHGTDALRYTMADMCTETQDIRMPVEYLCPHCGALVDQSVALRAEEQRRKSRGEKIERRLQPADVARVTCTGCKKEFATQWANAALKEELGLARDTSDKFDIGRNFCNKLWNAARFAFMNLEGTTYERLDLAALPTEDRWILARLSQTIRRVHAELGEYRFSAAINLGRDFFWDALCDWYIELTKGRMAGGEHGAEAKQVLAFCVDQVLRLMHPFIPFITERLWQQLNEIVPDRGLPGLAEPAPSELLITAEYPPTDGWPALDDADIVRVFELLQDATRGIRDLRSRNGVPPRATVTATVNVPAERLDSFRRQASILQRLAGVGTLHVGIDAPRPANAGTIVVGSMQIHIQDISDDEAERSRLTTEIAAVDKQIAAKEGKLANEKFVHNAKSEVVAAERERLAGLREQRATLAQNLAFLG